MIESISQIIYNYCGITFNDTYKLLFEKKVNQRIKDLQFSTVEEYYNFLRFNRQGKRELIRLIDEITVKETYFCREKEHFNILIKHILPDLLKIKNKIKILSAGCSYGAEPFSIAILLEEKGFADFVNIVGGDISISCLLKAKKGIFTENDFREFFPEKLRKKYFKKIAKDQFQLDEKIVKKVKFKYLNVYNEKDMRRFNDFQIIFCRNVLIYFDKNAKLRSLRNLYNALSDKGYLLLGKSESVEGVSFFNSEKIENITIYRKV